MSKLTSYASYKYSNNCVLMHLWKKMVVNPGLVSLSKQKKKCTRSECHCDLLLHSILVAIDWGVWRRPFLIQRWDVMMDVWRSTQLLRDLIWTVKTLDNNRLIYYYSLQVAIIDIFQSREVTFSLPFHSSHQHKHSGMYLTSAPQLHW